MILGFWFQRDYGTKADDHYRKGELSKAAELYLKAESHEQAAGVFVELGQTEQAVDCFLSARMPLKAAELLDRLGDYRTAIGYYERAGAYRQAAEVSLKAKQPERAGRNFEKAMMYRRAAESFAEVGMHEKALSGWEFEIDRLRQREDATSPSIQSEIHGIEMLRAEVLENLGRYGEAAEILRRHGVGTALRAARLFMKDRRFAEAAEAFLEANSTDDALEAVEQAEGADDALKAAIYLRCDKYFEAGDILERMDRFEEAATAFEQANAWERAAELFEKAENPRQAGDYFFRAGRYEDAARCFTQVKMHQEAGKAYVKLSRFEDAAQAFERAEMPLYAGNYYLKARQREKSFEILQQIDADDELYGQASVLLIPLLIEQQLIEGAEHRLEILGQQQGKDSALPGYMRWYLQGRVDEAQKRHEQAAAAYEKVLAEKHNYQDTVKRLMAVRSRLAGKATPPARAATKPGDEPASELSGAIPAELLLNPPVAVAPDLTGQPFVIQSQLEPWWHGVNVFEVLDRRGKVPMLMVAFPQSFLRTEPEQLKHKMGRFSGVGLDAVLTLHEVVLAHGNVLLLYEAFQGMTLARHLSKGTPPHNEGLNILRRVCDGLATGHKVNIVHQWLSPRTILVDSKGNVKLVGLGLHDVLAKHDHESRAYQSPETRSGGESSPASDLFSLGLLGVELLRAYMPADWNSTALDPSKVRWPKEAEKAVPKHVRHLLLSCLKSDIMKRPSAEELRSGLRELGFLPGQLLLNRYEIKGELGRGGMSRVYRAKDLQFDEEVAIKTVSNLGSIPTEDSERLLREVQICRKISHPNVVRVHDFGRFDGGMFVIMEVLNGPGLDDVIEKEAPVSLERASKLLTEICAALAEAHHLQVVHRDLKPGNVMLVGDRVKVLDFGIAHMNDGQSKQLTKVGEVVGSPLYMAPEQIQGLPLAGTCDLYALGVIAYNLLTGQEPFYAETSTAVVFKHLHDPPPDLLEFRPNLPRSWVRMVGKLLEKSPDDRYQTAEEVVTALSRLPV